MSDATTMTLRCEHGDEGHDWTRPAQRGRPPRFCPEHRGTSKPRVKTNVLEAQTKAKPEPTPEELEAKREKMRKAREAKEKKAAERAAQEAQKAKKEAAEQLDALREQEPQLYAEYNAALEKALKSNKDEDWRRSESLMQRAMGVTRSLRAAEKQAA